MSFSSCNSFEAQGAGPGRPPVRLAAKVACPAGDDHPSFRNMPVVLWEGKFPPVVFRRNPRPDGRPQVASLNRGSDSAIGRVCPIRSGFQAPPACGPIVCGSEGAGCNRQPPAGLAPVRGAAAARRLGTRSRPDLAPRFGKRSGGRGERLYLCSQRSAVSKSLVSHSTNPSRRITMRPA